MHRRRHANGYLSAPCQWQSQRAKQMAISARQANGNLRAPCAGDMVDEARWRHQRVVYLRYHIMARPRLFGVCDWPTPKTMPNSLLSCISRMMKPAETPYLACGRQAGPFAP